MPVPAGALESEAAVANNVLPGRSGRSLSTQGALQRVREATMASAEQLLSASAAREAALVKGLPASQGKHAVLSTGTQYLLSFPDTCYI